MKTGNISQIGLNLKNNVIAEPLLLTLIPTHKCTASCDGCCFSATPKVEHIMSYEMMAKHIDEVLDFSPSLQVVVITGGECFLLEDHLDEIVYYITKKGLKSRVVTNAYWASSYNNAYKRLQSLKEKGLTEINFSTGDYHQKFIDFQNIINAIKVAVDLEFTPLYIAIEGDFENSFTENNMKNHPDLKELIDDKKMFLTTGKWLAMNNIQKVVSPSKNEFSDKCDERCENIFKGITINPYSQLLACCGISVEHNKYLKIGNLQEYSLNSLYNRQFNDLFKTWLYTHGPKYIYERIKEESRQQTLYFSHQCAYCMEVIKEENVLILKKIISKYIPIIMYQIQIMSEYEKY